MAKIPNIVRARLRHIAAQSSAEHPDSNLLTGFIENTLPKRERTSVVAHLAQCADCRECVALGSSTDVSESLRRSAWRFSPVWRWVAGAAVAACLVTVIFVREIDVSRSRVHSNRAPAVGTRKAEVATTARGLKPSVEPIAEAPQVKNTKRARRPSAKPTEQQIAVAKQEAAPEQVAAPAVPAQPQPQAIDGVIGGIAPAPRDLSKPAEQQMVIANPQPAPQQVAPAAAAQPQVMDRVTTRQKASASPPARSAFMGTATSGLGNARAFGTAMQAPRRLSRPGALWSINATPDLSGKPSGVLQKSMDGGKTWQIVHVADGVDFREVVTDGASVWAGGSDGALFHSSDGGAHWEQIRVANDGTTLTGTIVGIDTEAPAQVRITANSGEEWISEDGGVNWRRAKGR